MALARGRLDGSNVSVRAALLAIGIAIVAACSAAGSVHQGKSLEAMLNLLAILGLFLATIFFVRGTRLARWLVSAQVLCALPVAVIGVLQHFRPELVPTGSSYPGRALGPLGPFGQPNRLGGYLIAALPLAVTLAFLVQDRMIRGALLGSALLLALCLVLTYSRGAWISIALAAVVFALLLARWPGLSPRPMLVGLALATLILPALLLLPSVVSRIAPRAEPGKAWNLPFDPEREGSAAMRGSVWEGSLAAAAERPVLGWGIGAFREAFDRSKSDTMKRLEAEGGRTSDQAHGYYLATLVERGIPGVALFAFLAVAALVAGMATIGSGAPTEARLLAAGLVASVTALLANAFLEDNLAFAPHSVILQANLGLLLAAGPRTASGTRRAPLLGGAGVALALVAMGFGLQSARADAGVLNASRVGTSGAVADARRGFAEAGRLAPWSEKAALGEAKAAEALGEFLRSESAYRRAVALNPSDPVTKHELARLYLAHEDRFGGQATSKATPLLESALAQNPYYAEIRNDLGVARLRAGDRQGAVRAFRDAAEGRASFVDPLVNLAALALEDGDRASAASWIRRALERNPGSAPARAIAADLGLAADVAVPKP